MRIGIDMSFVSLMKTGVGYYATSLIKALSKVDSKNKYVLYLRRESLGEFHRLGENFTIKTLPAGRRFRVPRFQLYFSYAILRDKLDLFFSPNYLLPIVCPVRSITTVYDLTHIIVPDKHKKKHLVTFGLLLPHSMRKSSKIVAISENTRKDIIREFGIPAEKITVAYGAALDIYRPVEDKVLVSNTVRKYGISEEYVLFVGTLEPRKNISKLIEAFGILKKDKRIKHKLVVTGKKGWKYGKVFESVERLNLKDEIIFTGYVSEEEMVHLYNGAVVMVYPSLYEGFGLPPLEAMACGTPVITSETSSLPEVVGDAAILIDPNNTAQIAESILKVLENSDLRNELSSKGIKRSGVFSWEKTAEKVVSLFLENHTKHK